MQPERSSSSTHVELGGALDAVVRRLRLRQAFGAAAMGCLAGAALAVVLFQTNQPRSSAAIVAGLAVAAAIVLAHFAGRRTRTRAAAAGAIERHVPACRNVVITAEELLRTPNRAASWIESRVFDDAARLTREVRPSDVVPLRGAITVALIVFAVYVGVLVVDREAADVIQQLAQVGQSAGTARDAGPIRIVAVVEPPAYLRLPARTVDNPERIDAVEGSRVRLRLGGTAARVRYGTRAVPVATAGRQREADVVLTDSSYFAIEPIDGTADKRLIPVAVTPDHVPAIRIEAPGRDLLLADASGSVAITATASDDFALRELEIRYTRVSGSGEQFEFVEGALPISLERTSDRVWRGAGILALPALKLAPGDSLVYRAVARDARPGDAGIGSSDTFFVEIAGPGQVALAGFEMPPARERHALSQQMIVLKIERLRARERALTREAIQEQAAAIAAEQRAVRANFIFLMGGHVEDEEEEAEQSHEIQEGRLKNDARAEISAAIGHMTRAEQALTAAQTGAALPPAKAAVDALQRAFGRNRYLLRTLPVRSRIDPARRLSGDLAAATDWRRALQPATPDPETSAARAFLRRVLDLAPAFRGERAAPQPETFAALAEQALAAGPSDPGWQQIARDLEQLRNRLVQGRSIRDLAPDFQNVITAATARAQRRTASAPLDPPGGALRSAWAEGRKP